MSEHDFYEKRKNAKICVFEIYGTLVTSVLNEVRNRVFGVGPAVCNTVFTFFDNVCFSLKTMFLHVSSLFTHSGKTMMVLVIRQQLLSHVPTSFSCVFIKTSLKTTKNHCFSLVFDISLHNKALYASKDEASDRLHNPLNPLKPQANILLQMWFLRKNLVFQWFLVVFRSKTTLDFDMCMPCTYLWSSILAYSNDVYISSFTGDAVFMCFHIHVTCYICSTQTSHVHNHI